jgi:hypothetical protein
MFPILSVVGQNSAPPTPAWNLVLDMRFEGNFSDTAGRHSPVSYGAITTGGRLYANQDGRVFTDDYNGESADFDFTTKDFRISCDIQPTSIGNDYVWMKSSGGNFGICLKLGMSGSDVIAYLRGIGNVDLSLGVIVPNATSTANTILVERIGDVWTLYLNGVASDTETWSEVNRTTGGTGYKGFQIFGASNDNRYSGYLDNFKVWTA